MSQRSKSSNIPMWKIRATLKNTGVLPWKIKDILQNLQPKSRPIISGPIRLSRKFSKRVCRALENEGKIALFLTRKRKVMLLHSKRIKITGFNFENKATRAYAIRQSKKALKNK